MNFYLVFRIYHIDNYKIANFFFQPFLIEEFQTGRENFAVIILNNLNIKNGLFGCIERSNQIFLDKAKNYLKSYNDTREQHDPEYVKHILYLGHYL